MITIVSGLPRSGTSLMMQMLGAAGLCVLSDGIRKADSGNPRGYLEWEPIKQLPRNPSLIAAAEGKAVKVISALLPFVPRGFDYRVIFMQRNLQEVAASQRDLAEHLQVAGRPRPGPAELETSLALHYRHTAALLAARADLSVLFVPHARLLGDPYSVARLTGAYLGLADRVEEMVAVVDQSLHRHRRSQECQREEVRYEGSIRS
jgi:hypothetical protein